MKHEYYLCTVVREYEIINILELSEPKDIWTVNDIVERCAQWYSTIVQ